MPTLSPPGGPGLPQSGNNRTRGAALAELLSYLKMEEDVDGLTRAGRAWEASVREFNNSFWKFNRQVVDITFSDLATDGQYDLPTTFKRPERAILLDTNGKETIPLDFMPFEDKVRFAADETAPGPRPALYTAFNIHLAGKVRYWPVPLGATQFPKARHIYFSEILVATGDDDRINVPMEVDEAIFQLALAKFTHMMRNANAARTEYALADKQRLLVEKLHRGWPDPTG